MSWPRSDRGGLLRHRETRPVVTGHEGTARDAHILIQSSSVLVCKGGIV